MLSIGAVVQIVWEAQHLQERLCLQVSKHKRSHTPCPTQRPCLLHVPAAQACPVATRLLTEEPAHLQTCHVRSAWPTWGLRGLLRGMMPLRALPSCPDAVCTKLWGTWGPPLASSACRTYCTSSSFGPVLSAPMPACIIRLRHC